jgi:hypothetical protein
MPREKVEEWRAGYNEVRPHSAGDRTLLSLIHLSRQHLEESSQTPLSGADHPIDGKYDGMYMDHRTFLCIRVR